MITFEEACKLAVSKGMGYDYCVEYENAYMFGWAANVETDGPQSLFVIKETGESLFMVEAMGLFNPGSGFEESKLIREGRIPDEYLPVKQGLRDVIYGAAVGDALGVPYEFKQRDTFECTDMVGYGTYNLPAGTFSDDTSMMLATCDSIRAKGRHIDVQDMRKRFVGWFRRGEYTADGVCFDIGNTTARALDEGKGGTGERDNGNGSLMRIAPLAYAAATDDEIRAVSAITHAHPISTEACVCFIGILRNIIGGSTLQDAIRYSKPSMEQFDFLDTVAELPREEIRSGGFVLDTLGAAIWCFANTESYADCVLAAVNLGGDTDTTACVAGALAGAAYGYGSIPTAWLETLRGKDIIESCLF